MADSSAKHLLLGDPLSDVTRKERRTLLAISVIGIAIVKTGLVPTKISALGVDFDKTNQSAILYLLAFITLYFLIAFLIYATADLLAWRLLLRRERIEWAREQIRQQRSLSAAEIEKEQQEIWKLAFGNYGSSFVLRPTPIATLRAIFEFALPVVVGIYAIILLWRYAPVT